MNPSFSTTAYSHVDGHAAPTSGQEKTEPHVAASLVQSTDGDSTSRRDRGYTVNDHQERRHSHSTISTWWSMWWKELFACLVLLASAVATFSTLYVHQNLPLPDWPHAITIGTLLSIYSVLFRMAVGFLLAEGLAQLKWVWFSSSRPLYDFVLHDGATRGPQGALSLLGHRHGPWQTLGCVLVVLTVLVGPFTQQVLQYQPCTVADEGSAATVARTMIFIGQGTHQWAGINSVTAAEQVAVDTGIYSPNPVSVTCHTGNCTFEPYVSLGYCSSCIDLSSKVKIATFNETYATMSQYDNGTMVSTPGRRLTTTSILTQNDTRFSTNLTNTFHDDLDQRPTNFAAISGGTILFGYTAIMNRYPFGVSGMTKPLDPATGVTPSGCNVTATGADATWRCRGYGAAKCSLFPCMRTYSAQMVNGQFTETIVSETADGKEGPFGNPSASRWVDGRPAYSALYLRCVNPSQAAQLQKLGYDTTKTNTSMPWVPYNTTAPQTSLEHDLLAQGCIAVSDYLFDAGLNVYLNQGNYNGNLTGTSNRQSSSIANFAGPPLLRTLHNYGNFSLERTREVYHNISLSLTNYMRATPNIGNASQTASYLGAGALPAQGVAYVDKTCLRVEWPWLTLPALLALATLAFVLAVGLGVGHRLGPEAASWRSSPLPLLFAGPNLTGSNGEEKRRVNDEGDVSTGYEGAAARLGRGDSFTAVNGGHVREMESAARETLVRLGRDGEDNLVLRREGRRIPVESRGVWGLA